MKYRFQNQLIINPFFFNSLFQDLLMVIYLTQLTKTQLQLHEVPLQRLEVLPAVDALLGRVLLVLVVLAAGRVAVALEYNAFYLPKKLALNHCSRWT